MKCHVFAHDDSDSDDFQTETCGMSRCISSEDHDLFRKRREKAVLALQRQKEESGSPSLTESKTSMDPSETCESDSLDLFMKKIEQQLQDTTQQTHGTTSLSFLPNKFDDKSDEGEEEDHVADFMEHVEKKMSEAVHDSYSDDDVEYGPDGSLRKKTIQKLLPPVDLSTIEFKPFPRNIYHEAPELASLTVEQRAEFRNKKRISVTGYKVPQPIHHFSHLKSTLEKRLLNNIASRKWHEPTSVQAQLISLMLSGRDVIAIAETGSGKTGGYLIPAIQHVCKTLDAWSLVQLNPGEGPIALVLCPTRELAMQTYDVAKDLSDSLRLRVSCFSGGYNKTQQVKEIRHGLEICIGTPGRIIDLVTLKGSVQLQLKHVTLLIVDEVDRMLDMGFYASTASIASALNPEKQMCFVSASLPPDVEKFILTLTPKTPVKFTVGTEGDISDSVQQEVVVFSSVAEKHLWTKNYIQQHACLDNLILIFCKTKQAVMDLCDEVPVDHVTTHHSKDSNTLKSASSGKSSLCRPLHADMSQADRSLTLTGFRQKKFLVLVSTDIAARGLDVSGCGTVINYDTAKTWETYLHRVGRSASRNAKNQCKKGLAFSLLVRGNLHDAWMAAMLTETFKRKNEESPQALIQLALTHEPFRAAQVSGRNFFHEFRSGSKKKKNFYEAAPILGSGRPAARTHANGLPQFVRESTEPQMSQTPSTVKRRWDAPASKSSNHSLCGTCSFPSSGDSSYSNELRQGTSEEGIKSSLARSTVKRPKIFKATDEIPSSSSDDDEHHSSHPTVSAEPSLLKIKTSSDYVAKIRDSLRSEATSSGKTSRWD